MRRITYSNYRQKDNDRDASYGWVFLGEDQFMIEREPSNEPGRLGKAAHAMPPFLFSERRREMSLIVRTLEFLVYYPLLRVRVLFGYHHTPNPIDLRWRWNYRKHKNERLSR